MLLTLIVLLILILDLPDGNTNNIAEGKQDSVHAPQDTALTSKSWPYKYEVISKMVEINSEATHAHLGARKLDKTICSKE